MNAAEIFRVLADPTRRAVFERLAGGEMTGTALRAGLDISQPALSQHVAALRGAGLIRERRAGRYVHYSVEPDGLAPLDDWLGRQRAFWPTRIARLKAMIEEMDR